MEIPPQIRLEARKELARRYFYDYCRLKYPKHYTDDRAFLRDICERVQAFSEQNAKRFLVVDVPPRHYKSFTAGGFVEWTFGQDPLRKVMTGSYNETLSTTFARKVRDTIDEEPSAGILTFRDIFPKTRVKYGQASAGKWALDGSTQDSYLATSPSGTATGFGANCLAGETLIDTPGGPIKISDLHNTRYTRQVLTYNHEEKIIEAKPVVATKLTKRQLVYKLLLNDSTTIKATARHRFWTQSGYQTMDWIMRHLPSHIYEAPLRGDETRAEGNDKQVLLEGLPTTSERSQPKKKLLPSLCEPDTSNQGVVLFKHVSEISQPEAASSAPLPSLSAQLPTRISPHEVLLNDVQEQVPRPIDYGTSEPPLQGRPRVPARVLGQAICDQDAGRQRMCPLHIACSSRCAPSRPQQAQQRRQQPDNTLPLVPHGVAQIEELGLEDVYDIQTESNHNFFANGVLTHNCIIIDDIIKSAEEAYSELVLDKHWSWLTNTMLSRTEGEDWKVYVFMTRWATNDLAGRIIDAYGDEVETIVYKAVQDDGSMLCDSILNRRDYDLKTKEMNPDIVEANYNQKPIDVKGRLYSEFGVYDTLPEGKLKKYNYTDTADKGTDFLCSVDYVEDGTDVYVTDLVMSDEGMEDTEPKVAAMLDADEVDEATVESNNGGRGFARNIERLLQDVHENRKCVVKWVAQTSNKEARILASSAWVNRHVFMPHNWKHKYPEFYRQVMTYQRKGKNKHDDGPDVLAAIYERVANPSKTSFRVRRA